MGISNHLVPRLEASGHDVTHLLDEGLESLPDPEILRKARDEERVLVVHDLDFPELVAASRSRLPSVVLLRLRDMRPGNVAFHLTGALERCTEALAEGAIVSVTENAVRVRALPIES